MIVLKALIVPAIFVFIIGGIWQAVENSSDGYDGFFRYRMRLIDGVPYWVIAVFFQWFVNGIYFLLREDIESIKFVGFNMIFSLLVVFVHIIVRTLRI